MKQIALNQHFFTNGLCFIKINCQSMSMKDSFSLNYNQQLQQNLLKLFKQNPHSTVHFNHFIYLNGHFDYCFVILFLCYLAYSFKLHLRSQSNTYSNSYHFSKFNFSICYFLRKFDVMFKNCLFANYYFYDQHYQGYVNERGQVLPRLFSSF